MHDTSPSLLGRWLLILGLLAAVLPAAAVEPDWQDYARLLERHLRPVTIGGVSLMGVDYRALHGDTLFPRVTAALARFDPARLEGRRERLAFYINAYNILAMKMVVDHWPLDSIKDAGSLFGSVWKQDAGVIGGRSVNLDQIEHRILRPMGEPRIHMAIVCASVSCPDLRPEPYRAARLDSQLDQQARAFLANPGKGLRRSGTSVRVSRIFHWFEEDFRRAYGGVAPFLRRYGPSLPTTVNIEADLPYDWSLNDAERGR